MCGIHIEDKAHLLRGSGWGVGDEKKNMQNEIYLCNFNVAKCKWSLYVIAVYET